MEKPTPLKGPPPMAQPYDPDPSSPHYHAAPVAAAAAGVPVGAPAQGFPPNFTQMPQASNDEPKLYSFSLLLPLSPPLFSPPSVSSSSARHYLCRCVYVGRRALAHATGNVPAECENTEINAATNHRLSLYSATL